MLKIRGQMPSHPWVLAARNWLGGRLLILKKLTPITSTAETQPPTAPGVDIAHLPRVLGFAEEDSPGLVAAHERLKTALSRHDVASAESVAATYKELAEIVLHNRQLRSEEDQRRYDRLRGGMLIQLAYNWSQNNIKARPVRRAYINALNEAIAYCRDRGWFSLVTALVGEKQKALAPQLY